MFLSQSHLICINIGFKHSVALSQKMSFGRAKIILGRHQGDVFYKSVVGFQALLIRSAKQHKSNSLCGKLKRITMSLQVA